MNTIPTTRKTETRIYVLAVGGAERMVRAPNEAQAVRHAARKTIEAHVASQDDILRLTLAGVQVEDSGRAAPEERQ